MASITYRDYETAEAFISDLRRSNETWWPSPGDSTPWIFRGVGDALNWKLLPSAWRSANNRLQPLIARIANANLPIHHELDMGSSHRLFAAWESAEEEAIYQFAQLANEIGFDVPAESLSTARSPLRRKFLQSLRGNGLTPDPTFIALAQHHGVPTRFLDWTVEPLVAAYFAAAPMFRNLEADSIAVWALNTLTIAREHGRPRDIGQFRIFVHALPQAGNRFLHSQGGIMTELLGAQSHFISESEWPALELVISRIDSEAPALICHRLPTTQCENVMQVLHREGINMAKLMPSLNNIASIMVSRW